jgi:hypothetical protein
MNVLQRISPLGSCFNLGSNRRGALKWGGGGEIMLGCVTLANVETRMLNMVHVTSLLYDKDK